MFWRRQRNKRNQDLERELRSDLELEAAEQEERGLSPEEACYAARRAFGNTTYVKEDVREVWGWASLERCWQDSRYALRTFRKAPAFTAIVLLSLALGIGGNTAVFTLLYTVLLKPLPVPDPWALVVLGIRDSLHPDAPQTRFSYPLLEALRARNHVLAGPFAYISDILKLSTGGEPEPVRRALAGQPYMYRPEQLP